MEREYVEMIGIILISTHCLVVQAGFYKEAVKHSPKM